MSVEINASFLESPEFNAVFSESEDLNAEFEATVVASDKPPYEGVYEITPSAHSAQLLKTAGCVMKNNVTVKIIPFFQTTNISGETVYIA